MYILNSVQYKLLTTKTFIIEFWPPFIFNDSNQHSPLIYFLNYLHIWFRFCREIYACKNSAVSLMLRSQAQGCHCHREVILGGVNDTAESNMIYLIFKISWHCPFNTGRVKLLIVFFGTFVFPSFVFCSAEDSLYFYWLACNLLPLKLDNKRWCRKKGFIEIGSHTSIPCKVEAVDF